MEHSVQEKLLSLDVGSALIRVANIVLETTEVDGVAFFDASIGMFGGLVEDLCQTENDNEEDRKEARPNTTRND